MCAPKVAFDARTERGFDALLFSPTTSGKTKPFTTSLPPLLLTLTPTHTQDKQRTVVVVMIVGTSDKAESSTAFSPTRFVPAE